MTTATEEKVTIKAAGRVVETTMDGLRAVAASVVPDLMGTVRRDAGVESLAVRLVAEFPETFGHIDQWAVVYTIDYKPPKKGCGAIAWVRLAPALWHDLYGPDVVVGVSSVFWEGADERRRKAALYHALAHLWTQVDENGEVVGLRKAEHDVAAFLGEVARFGAWRSEIGALADQLQLFSDSTAR